MDKIKKCQLLAFCLVTLFVVAAVVYASSNKSGKSSNKSGKDIWESAEEECEALGRRYYFHGGYMLPGCSNECFDRNMICKDANGFVCKRNSDDKCVQCPDGKYPLLVVGGRYSQKTICTEFIPMSTGSTEVVVEGKNGNCVKFPKCGYGCVLSGAHCTQVGNFCPEGMTFFDTGHIGECRSSISMSCCKKDCCPVESGSAHISKADTLFVNDLQCCTKDFRGGYGYSLVDNIYCKKYCHQKKAHIVNSSYCKSWPIVPSMCHREIPYVHKHMDCIL